MEEILKENEIENKERKEKQRIIIAPISFGKRILLFLADFFFLFMIAFTLYNAAVLPLSRVITSYNKKVNNYVDDFNLKVDVLYENKLLFYEEDNNKYNFDKSIDFTYKKFLSIYVLVDENADLKNPNLKFGPDYKENDIFYTYFVSLKTNEEKYNDVIKNIFNYKDYFVFENDEYKLKKDYREQLRSFYSKNDTPSGNAEKYYLDIEEKIFLNGYSAIMDDILINDLTFTNNEGQLISYISQQNKTTNFSNYEKNLYGYSSLICFLFCWAIYYCLIPLLNQRGRTLAMMMMKLERISTFRFSVLKRWERMFFAVYNLATNMLMILFFPMFITGFNFPFSISILFVLSVVSFLFVIFSFGFMLFSSYHRSISDFCSKSVAITSENLDEIYKVKGYGVFNGD